MPLFAPWGSLSRAKEKTTGNLLVASGFCPCRMVGVTELESVTSTMSTWRSNQLSYTPSCVFCNISPIRRFCKRVFKKTAMRTKKRRRGNFPSPRGVVLFFDGCSAGHQSEAHFAMPESTPFTALPPSDLLFGTSPPPISVPGTVGVIRTFPVPR